MRAAVEVAELVQPGSDSRELVEAAYRRGVIDGRRLERRFGRVRDVLLGMLVGALFALGGFLIGALYFNGGI